MDVCVGAIVVIGVIIAIISSIASAAAKNQEEIAKKELLRRKQILDGAENQYRNSLKRLKHIPTNADFKEKTLQLGREFSRLTRDFTATAELQSMMKWL